MKVLTYNIYEGGGRRLNDIAAVIRSQQPDVVALLEATRRWKAMRLARQLRMQLVFGRSNSQFHVAWLSKFPVRRKENHRIAGLSKTLLEIEVDWNGMSLQLFATHLAGGADTVHPADEMPIILDIIRRTNDRPHLLVGDLNALHPDDSVGSPPRGMEEMRAAIDDDPRQAIHEILAAGYIDSFRALNPQAPGYTYPAARPWLRFDYIFASPRMAARLDAASVIASGRARQASDHLPAWANFRETVNLSCPGRAIEKPVAGFGPYGNMSV